MADEPMGISEAGLNGVQLVFSVSRKNRAFAGVEKRRIFENPNRGFDRVEVLPLHPWDAGRVAGPGELTERFNGYFFGPMDYAIVGRKVEI